jgi:hypothetical protein
VIWKRREEASGGGGDREGAEIEAGDYGESAERADQEFVQVVAGDIFYDAASGFDLRAAAVDEFGAEQEIACSAVGVAQRGVEAGGDGAGDGRSGIAGNLQRQKLILLLEHGV